jgi:hypothetical protein
MSNLMLAKQISSPATKRRRSTLAEMMSILLLRLRRRSRQEAQAEAIANRFGSDRWSDAIERELSIRVR